MRTAKSKTLLKIKLSNLWKPCCREKRQRSRDKNYSSTLVDYSSSNHVPISIPTVERPPVLGSLSLSFHLSHYLLLAILLNFCSSYWKSVDWMCYSHRVCRLQCLSQHRFFNLQYFTCEKNGFISLSLNGHLRMGKKPLGSPPHPWKVSLSITRTLYSYQT